jgi:Helix-turn-helix domain
MSYQAKWLSTQEVATRLGMSSEWVRRQVLAGRLKAVVYRTTSRAVYRISETSLADFRRRFSRDASSTT